MLLPLSYGLEVIRFLDQTSPRPRTGTDPHYSDNEVHRHRTNDYPDVMASVNLKQNRKPAELVFRDVCVFSGEKEILCNVSGKVRPGELLSVMGPSGSGKTTLLNTLSGRQKINSGLITVNGEPIRKQQRRNICYVLQEDVFFANLTVRQVLTHSALLRLPDAMPYHEKMFHVERIIDVLDLRQCLNNIIGDGLKRGLSGGEKKRTSIACELLTNPTTMLLDEPTSGLDSGAAVSLMSTLKYCAEKEHKTVVVTVHQPSSQIFHMFDRLLLLTDGQVAYFGPTNGVFEFFSNIGLHIAAHYNPADFIIGQLKKSSGIREKLIIAAKDLSEVKEVGIDIENTSSICEFSHLTSLYSTEAEDTADSGVSSWPDLHDSAFGSDISLSEEIDKWPTCFWTQLKILSRRNFQEAHYRMLSRLNWIQTVGLGIVSGLLWFQVERTETNLSDIQGWVGFGFRFLITGQDFLFAEVVSLFSLTNGTKSSGVLLLIPSEREVINKERASGTYRLSAYYLAKMVGELPLTVTLPSVFHCISYSMLGLHDPRIFLSLWGFLLLNTVVAQSVGLLVGALCVDLQVSVTVSALYSLSTMLFGGFYAKAIPSWLLWLRYLSMVHYAFNNMQMIEFGGDLSIRCASHNSQFEACRHGNSSVIPVEDIIEHQGISLPLWANTMILLIFLCVFRLMGYLILRYIRKPR
ncbi:ABC transporter G family member 14-like [Limulus polyphemus]|uniref:ABC transporter G family member 14-like n=1 Tax=Limulus polyphemus TaxID=6850 RepID=A0ABM1SUG3_LIMPO|nr:ABC transporter G family member 14-like [Limulus polyphemus]